MTKYEPVGWMARCPKTGGRLFAHTEAAAKERGREAYAPHHYEVRPVFTANGEQGEQK